MSDDDGIKSIIFGDSFYVQGDNSDFTVNGFVDADTLVPNVFDDIIINTDSLSNNAAIELDGEKLDARMLKKIKMLFQAIENDPNLKHIMEDINTQIAFEELSRDNEN